MTPASINVGKIAGGTAVNVTPDLCMAEIDVRGAPGISAANVVEQIRKSLPDGITLDVMDFKTAVEAAPDSPFVQTCARAILAQTGRAPQIKGAS